MRIYRALPYLAVAVLIAAIVVGILAGYREPEFLGPYILFLGEFLAVVYVFRSVERKQRLGHLGLLAVTIFGTFVVLVSVSVCGGGLPEGDVPCTPAHYWHALRGMMAVLWGSTVLVAIAVATYWLPRILVSLGSFLDRD